MKKVWSIAKDMFINILSSMIPTIVLQLIVLPFVSKELSQEIYGNMVSIVAINTVVAITLGNVWNNVRLLLQEKYNKAKSYGDFGILILGSSILCVIVVVACIAVMGLAESILDYVLIAIISVLALLHGYVIVVFRLNLDFIRLFINNLMLSAGYFVGYLLLLFFDMKWQWVYIFGYSFSIAYTLLHSSLLQEGIRKTKLFPEAVREGTTLLIATGIGNFLNYSDRIILNPMLGGEGVTIYYVSTLIGKLVSMVVSPINAVILSYLAKIEKLSKRLEDGMLVINLGVCTVGYIVCMLCSKIILKFLYPEYYIKAMEYVPITTMTAMVIVFCSVVSPFVLKFCSRMWQAIINLVVLVFYLLFAILGYTFLQLQGFCIGILMAYTIKAIVLVVILKRHALIEEQPEP